MTDFTLRPTINPYGDRISAALGASSSAKLTENDIGKPVKLSTAENYIVCTAADEIEGFLVALSDFTVNDGFSHGTVQKDGMFLATVDAAQVGTLTIRDLCVAGTSAAVGTAETAGYPKVIEGTPANFKWRVVSIVSGTGAAGDVVVIEKI